MPLIHQARAALQAGDYALAIDLYERAMVEQPELAHLYQPSLDRLRRRQGLIQQGTITEASDATSASNTAPAQPASPTQAGGPVVSNRLYQQVARALPSAPMPDRNTSPLVSVLMTAHSVADYIDQAVTSVLRQSWPKLELIVVDGASTDATWAILQRPQKTVGNLRCLRLNTNLDTYFAENHALQLARGAFIYFQNGDDTCHPDRIRLSMHPLLRPGVVGVQGACSRVRFRSGQVLPLNRLISKWGLITLGLRREVFDQIGYFNCSSKAPDEEFFRRLQAQGCGLRGVLAATRRD